MSENPFVYTRAVGPDLLIDREAETASMIDDALGGHYVRLTAPRRYGKTSLIGKVFERATANHRMACVRVDLYGVVSVGDLVVRVERAYSAQLRGRLRTAVESTLRALDLGLSLGAAGFSAHVRRHPATTDPLPALHAVLDLPLRMHEHTKRRSLIAFDEFQSIGQVKGADEILRSHIEVQGDAAAYIFCGSEPGMMRQLFGTRARPLFGQAKPLTLGPLPDAAAAEFIAVRFRDANRDCDAVLPTLLHEARGHPQRLMMLAHELFGRTPSGSAAGPREWQEALDGALDDLDDEFRGLWSSLNRGEQRVLRAIAAYGSPLTQAGRTAFGVTKGTVGPALRALRDHGDLGRNGYQVIDPLFERWVRDRLGAGAA